MRRFTEALPVAVVLGLAYFVAGLRLVPSAEPIVTLVDGRVPFVPETVWLYLPGYTACFLVTLAVVRDAGTFRAALAAFGVVTALALPFFVLMPIAGPRPPAPLDPTLSAAFVRWLYANDPNVNTFPSLHVANATLCAAVTSRAHRRWGALVWALAVGIWVSVLTLKQHWVADVPAGLALATAGVGVFHARVSAPAIRARLASHLFARVRVPTLRDVARRLDPTERRRTGW